MLGAYEYLVIGLFRRPLESVWAVATETVWEHSGRSRWCAESGPLDCGRVYQVRPPAGGAHAVRAVFFEPGCSAGTTAMIANLEDGWFTLVNVIAHQLPGEHVQLRTSEDPEYPLADFTVWRNGEAVRTVRAARDESRWEFYAEGESCAFEVPGLYQRHRVRDRLNRAVLVGYARQLGWDLEARGFWQTDVPAHYLFEDVAARPGTPAEG